MDVSFDDWYWERESIESQVWLKEFEMKEAGVARLLLFTRERELDRNDVYLCRDDLVWLLASIISWQLISIDHSFNYIVKLLHLAVKCTFFF